MQMRTPLSIRMAERNSAMERIILDVEAGQVSAELVRRGIADARVHVWQVWDATSGFEWCLWNQLQANGHAYCDLTSLKQSHP